MVQMILPTKQKLNMNMESRIVVARAEGGECGMDVDFGVVIDANYYI